MQTWRSQVAEWALLPRRGRPAHARQDPKLPIPADWNSRDAWPEVASLD